MPLLFMFLGYLIIYVIGAPVINFATSSVELILLNDAPNFEKSYVNLLEKTSAEEKEKILNNEGKIPSSVLNFPMWGEQFGEISISKVGINEPLYYGDSEDILKNGAGQYIGSMIPGETGVSLIGGHNMPSFGNIYYLTTGDEVKIYTHYGEYTYQVTETKVSSATDPLVVERLADRSKQAIILYTCFPLDAIGMTPDRVFVFADYVSGPMIDENS